MTRLPSSRPSLPESADSGPDSSSRPDPQEGPVRLLVEPALVAQHVALDLADLERAQALGERLERGCGEVQDLALVRERGQARVTVALEVEVSVEDAPVDRHVGAVELRLEAVLRPPSAQGGRGGDELHRGGRSQAGVGVARKDLPGGVEVPHVHAGVAPGDVVLLQDRDGARGDAGRGRRRPQAAARRGQRDEAQHCRGAAPRLQGEPPIPGPILRRAALRAETRATVGAARTRGRVDSRPADGDKSTMDDVFRPPPASRRFAVR